MIEEMRFTEGDQFCVWIKKYRVSRGWSRAWIAGTLQVPYQTWLRWESGHHPHKYVEKLVIAQMQTVGHGGSDVYSQ